MKFIILSAFVIPSLCLLYLVNNEYLHPKMNTKTLEIPGIVHSDFFEDGLEVAVIGDIHVGDETEDYNELSSILEKIVRSSPDLILLLGDYTTSVARVSDMGAHRAEVIDRLSVLTPFPVAAVMGNYETLSDSAKWKRSIAEAGIFALHNEVAIIKVKGKSVCVRGFGDAFTKQFQFVDFPSECDSVTRITITHDPGAAFKEGVEGIIFAAHTHCGQIRFPLVGAVWMPTDAPRRATCGSYEDDKMLLWVTSGVGTSILPVRLGAQAQWDFLRLTAADD